MPLDRIHRSAMRSMAILALTMTVIFANQLAVAVALPGLPPRPTPAVTPSPTLRPPVRSHASEEAEPISHIVLMTAPAADGLWTVVQWQGQDGAWHDVAGWRGTLVAGTKRWAVLEKNFGEGPFRWVVYTAPGGKVLGISQTFDLPSASDEQVVMLVVVDRSR